MSGMARPPSKKQQDVINQLTAMGIDLSQAQRALIENEHFNTDAAIEWIFANPTTTPTPPRTPQHTSQHHVANSPTYASTAGGGGAGGGGHNRMPQLLEAVQRHSTAPHNTPAAKPAVAPAVAPPTAFAASAAAGAGKSSEDVEMAQAMALSLQEAERVPAQLQLPAAVAASGVSADEQAAIMASIMSSAGQREEGAWVDPANPHQRTRRAGVPTGLRNTGSICYFNSLVQVYFHLRPTLFRAIMALQQPRPPVQTQERPLANVTNITTSSAGGTYISKFTQKSAMIVNGRTLEMGQYSNVIMNENGIFVDGKLTNGTINVNGQSIEIDKAQNVVINDHGVFIDGKQVNLDQSAQPNAPIAAPTPAVLFLLSLQKLFAGLHLSNRRYLDPMATVNALFAASGHSAKEQRMQHDASEFHDLIVETMHNALSPATAPSPTVSATTAASSPSSSSPSAASSSASPTASSPASSSSGVVRDMFFADAIQEVRYPDDKGAQQTLHNSSLLGPLILHIGGGSLMSALDEYTYTTLDYRASASSAPTPATSSLWFERLPTVLCFQLQRVGFDPVKKEAVKDNRFFRLDERIWMDRYLLHRQVESMAKRSEAGGWKEQRAKVEAEMKRLTDYNGSGLALNAALDASAHYISSLPGDASAPASYSAVAASLSKLSADITASLSQLTTEQQRLTALIDHAYDSMRSDDSEYRLLAVLVHDGKEAGTGHYWSYIRRTRREEEESKSDGASAGQFWKYNDAVVSAVDDATMRRESEGGQPNTNASAYFLVYIKRSEAEAADVDVDALIPYTLLDEVQKDNEKLAKETEEWDVKEENKMIEAEADKVKKRYVENEAHLKELDKRAEKKEEAEEGVDWRLFSLPAFLKLHPLAAQLNTHQLPHYQLLVDALSEVQGAANFQKRVKERAVALLQKDGHHAATIVSQPLLATDLKIVEERRREWEEYTAASVEEIRGLQCLTEGGAHAKAALQSMIRAHSLWQSMSAAKIAEKYDAKQRELSVYLQLALYLFYMSTKLRLRSSATPDCYTDLQLVSAVSTVFPSVRPFYQHEIVLLADERDDDDQLTAVVNDFIAADMTDDDDTKATATSPAPQRTGRLSALLARLGADVGGGEARVEEDKAMRREGLFAVHSRLCGLVGVKLRWSLARVKRLVALGGGEGDEEREEEVGEVEAWMAAGGALEQAKVQVSGGAVRQEEKDGGVVDAEMGKGDASSEARTDNSIAGSRATAAPMDDSS